MGEWLTHEAQSASPFVAVFCVAVLGLLWRQIVQKDRTIISMLQSFGNAMQANAVAMERGAAAAQAMAQEVRDQRTEITDLKLLVAKLG